MRCVPFALMLICGLGQLMPSAHAESPAAVTPVDSARIVAETKARDAEGNRQVFADGPFGRIAFLLGAWEINTTWAGGTKLWSYNEFTIGLGGRTLEARTFARDGDGEPYERYRTVFTADPETGAITSYGFTNDGSVTIVDAIVIEGNDEHPALTSQWSMGGGQIKQTVTHVSDDAYDWQVWSRSDEAGDWQPIMEGRWTRAQ